FILPNGYILLEQDNGLEVAVSGFRKEIHKANYHHVGGFDDTYGSATGSIDFGNSLTFNAIWNEGPGAGLSNHYEGTINLDGSAQGTTINNLGTTNNWTTYYARRFACVT